MKSGSRKRPRGLKNFRTTVDCVPYYLDIKNVDLFARHRVYSEIELAARYKMKLDNYCKVIRIEAQTMQEMVWQDILPAASAYSKQLSDTAIVKAQLGIDNSFEKGSGSQDKHPYERNGQKCAGIGRRGRVCRRVFG